MPNSVAMSTRPTRAPASAGGKVLAHDDRVGRHDAALEQAEQRRDHVERRQAVERQEQQQRTPCRTEPSSSVRRPPMRSQIQPEASRLTMPKPSISDSISAPRAAP